MLYSQILQSQPLQVLRGHFTRKWSTGQEVMITGALPFLRGVHPHTYTPPPRTLAKVRRPAARGGLRPGPPLAVAMAPAHLPAPPLAAAPASIPHLPPLAVVSSSALSGGAAWRGPDRALSAPEPPVRAAEIPEPWNLGPAAAPALKDWELGRGRRSSAEGGRPKPSAPHRSQPNPMK